MDSDSWPRISSYSRRYQPRSDAYRGEDFEVEDEQRPEFLCPFCADDFDVVGLCCHIDEEHAIEAKNGHGNLLKVQRRRRLRRGSNLTFSILRKELREGNVQSLLGGSSFPISSSRAEPDPLLSSFINNPQVVDEPSNIKSLSPDASSVADNSAIDLAERASQQCRLSDEDLRERAKRCKFVQGLVLSTFLDDENL